MALFFLIPIVAGVLTIGAVGKHELNSGARMMGSAEPGTTITVPAPHPPSVAGISTAQSPMQEHPKVYLPCAKNGDKGGPHDDCQQNDKKPNKHKRR